MKHGDFLKLDKNDTYNIHIDSTLKKGNLTYSDLIIPGKVENFNFLLYLSSIYV